MTSVPATPSWLNHAWDKRTFDWLFSLDFDVAGVLFQASFSEIGSQATKVDTMPSEDFILRLLRRFEAEEASQGLLCEDEFVDAWLKVDFEEGGYFLDSFQLMTAVTFTPERARNFTDLLILPLTKRPYLAPFRDQRALFGAILGQGFPEEVVEEILAETIKKDEKGERTIWAQVLLNAWEHYCGTPRDGAHLARCADLLVRRIIQDDNLTDSSLYVDLLANTTSHSNFPEAWVAEHERSLTGAYLPVLSQHSSNRAFADQFPHAYSASTFWPVSGRYAGGILNLAPEEVNHLWSAPEGLTDEDAFAYANKLALDPENAYPVLPVMGHYFHQIASVKEEFDFEDVPDEWVATILA